jgi:hypothetical protein
MECTHAAGGIAIQGSAELVYEVGVWELVQVYGICAYFFRPDLDVSLKGCNM